MQCRVAVNWKRAATYERNNWILVNPNKTQQHGMVPPETADLQEDFRLQKNYYCYVGAKLPYFKVRKIIYFYYNIIILS